ncbi:MAG: TonB-dependent receptor plug domain-containing protein [Acidobacteria bacterium]|nr:TonB-dependent receptor plug domain-containing protein [Acidobacteriota bacterium]
MKFRLVAICLISAASAWSQTGSITGRVTDPTGAVIPGAKIEVRSVDTGIAVTAETNAEGYYNVPSLQPGGYDVSATQDGFVAQRRPGLRLLVQQIARLDFQLELGSVTETVEVNAQNILLDSESSTVGQVIGTRQISELPLLGRNPYALAMLAPGVRPASGVNNLPIDQISTVSFMINGQRASTNEFLLDGAPNSAPSQNQPVVNTNPDAILEFKVETNNFSAEYGRAAGGIFNVVTKSGGNDFHGGVYEFLRNEKLNANDFFANQGGSKRPPFKFNQFGGTFGGPIIKNRTFFFGSVELVRFVQGITFTGTVPQLAQLAGDFSNTRNGAGNVVKIYDPQSTTPNPSGSGFLRTQFANNMIPLSRIDPVAAAVSSYFPAPNTAGNAVTGVNNFSRTTGNRVDKNTYSMRIDHNFTDSNRIFWRYSYDDTPFVRAAPYGPDNPASPGTGPQVFTRKNAVIEDTHTFSPTLIGSFRYSVTRLINHREPFSDGFDLASLGLPSNLQSQIGEPRAFPRIDITGLSVTGSIPNIVVGGALGATDLIRLGNTTHAFQGSMTKSLNSHTLKWGAEYRVIQFNNQQTGSNAILFNFTPQWTQGPNPSASSATAGAGLASMLVGVGAGSITPAPPLTQTNKYYGIFLQDSWKLTAKLTMNYGLRWEYETPRTDRYNQLTNFDYNAPAAITAPGLDLRGGLTFVGVDGASRYNARPDHNNFAPRLGLAYQLNKKTVVRAGGGLFYGPLTGIGTGSGSFGVSGFQASTSIVTSIDGVTPIFNWSNPYPQGLNQPTGSSQGLATLLGQNIGYFDRGNRTPYSGQWNFNIQHQLPSNMVFEIGYVGSRGLKFAQTRQFNQLPDSALALGEQLRGRVANPFAGQIDVGTLAQAQVTQAQLLRPFAQFGNVTSMNENWASSMYHALQTRLEKRFTDNLSFLASYTYSKLMDYGVGPFAGESLGGQTFQNWNNLAAEWSPSTSDMTHRFIVNAVYELPRLRDSNPFVKNVVGGWQLGGIWSAFSGGPLGVVSAVNNTFSQGGGQRPNWTGVNPAVDNPTPQRWLDGSVFSNPASFSFGNAPRTFNGTRSANTSQVDMTLSKNFRFYERYRLQFRTEVFNITNTARFAPPNVTFGNAQFGVVSAQGNQPRIIQFALKLNF